MTGQFKKVVPLEAQEKLLALAMLMQEDLTSLKCESYGDVNLEQVSGVSYDGFWAWQNGGYEVNALIRCDQDPSYHPCNAMTEWADEQSKYCWKSFLEDNNLPLGAEWDDLTDKQQNDLSDYETEFFEGALLQFECWQEDNKNHNLHGEYNIFMRISVNFRDAPYFRSKSADTLAELTIPQDEFLKMDMSALCKVLLNRAKNVNQTTNQAMEA